MTIIAIYDMDGHVCGRCDKRCYNAQSLAKTCHCVCGGVNHGFGEQHAIEAVRIDQDGFVTCWHEDHNESDIGEVRVTVMVNQLPLFSIT